MPFSYDLPVSDLSANTYLETGYNSSSMSNLVPREHEPVVITIGNSINGKVVQQLQQRSIARIRSLPETGPHELPNR